MNRKVVAIVVFLAAFFGLLACVFWASGYARRAVVAPSQVERESLADLIPSPIPYEDNAAQIYQEVFRLLGKDEPTDLPPCLEAMAGNEAAIQSYLEDNRDALLKLRDALDKPRCQFRIDYEKGNDAQLPHLSGLRRCARLLAWDALCRRSRGDLPGAVEICRMAWRVSLAVSEEPFLVSFATGASLDAIAWTVTRDLVGHTDLPSSLLNPLLVELVNREIPEDRLTWRLKMERACALKCFDQIRADPKALHALLGNVAGMPLDELTDSLWTLTGTGLDEDQAAYLRIIERFVEKLRMPLPGRLSAFEMEAEKKALPLQCMVTRMLMPSLSQIVAYDAINRAQLHLACLGLALKLFRAKHGAYPDQLAQLMPECLAKLPDDPFGGQPYRYAKKGDGFVVYSVGRNRVDDGGVEDPKNREKGDIVFEVKK